MTSCVPASLLSPAATKTPTTLTTCAPIPPSSWPAIVCLTAAAICPHNLVWLFHQLRWRNLEPASPTVSRWENAPTPREVIRMTYAMIDLYCASYARPPAAVTLDIDDTPNVVHGHQQLSLFNSHYGERCFLPIHVYDTATGRPVAVLLRPGKTPSGAEIRGHLRRLVRRIRLHWPDIRLTIRRDSPEAP